MSGSRNARPLVTVPVLDGRLLDTGACSSMGRRMLRCGATAPQQLSERLVRETAHSAVTESSGLSS
ncbi:hypothetical protein ACFVYE_41775 [Streptomyces sp. NPDC058239]|uniref:hypothetical protein n=1 Tax=Streptomyces sp. NPDC058239 TaxID=3346395 RepID=UPI0036E99D60